ncbi:MAG: dihydrolipoamide acetyltransferase family protein [Acidithiobacillus sp.]
MKQPITMPVLSDTMETGRLVRWNKQPGAAVKKGEALAEVETDKAILDVEAFADGFLAGPLAPVDTDIPVRQVIGYLVDQAGEGQEATVPAARISEPAPSAAPAPTSPPPAPPRPTIPPATAIPSNQPATPEKAATAAPPSAPLPTGAPASPYARALAGDLGINIAGVAPGPDGAIHATQVLAAALAAPEADLRQGPPYTLERPSTLRAAVARNMVAAMQTPTFQISAQLPVEPLHQAARKVGITLTLAVTRACAVTVAEDPWFNHVWTAKGVAKRERVDVGIAVDTGDGLVTPVLRDAARRPLAELAEDWRLLLGKVKKGRLSPEDYQGASFYLSNLGVFPVISHFSAIVPLGASAILAIAATDAHGQADFTLSCDHRVIFGADAARFLAVLAKRLAQPESWLA